MTETTYRQLSGRTDFRRSMSCVAEYPARSVWELERSTRYNDHRPGLELRDGDLLCCPEGLTTYTVGSVVSYALKNGDDPIEAYQMAVERGHSVAWINTNASCISASRSEPKVCIIIRPGDLVRIEGRTYRVRAGNNRPNLILYREELEDAQA